MIEELVKTLARLQADRKVVEEDATDDLQVTELTKGLAMLEMQMAEARKTLTFLRAGYDTRISEINDEIKRVSAQIIEEWDGEKKTLPFDKGTLKFRTSESLIIEKEALVLTGLLDHTSVKDVADNYITGFNKTAVKKFMGVLSLPMGAAWIDRKTTVKLEVPL